MTCRLTSTKPLSEPMLVITNLTLRDKHQWNFNQNTKLFIHENASENIVYEMAAILSRVRWVDWNRWDFVTQQMHLIMSSAKCRPVHLGINMLIVSCSSQRLRVLRRSKYGGVTQEHCINRYKTLSPISNLSHTFTMQNATHFSFE